MKFSVGNRITSIYEGAAHLTGHIIRYSGDTCWVKWHNHALKKGDNAELWGHSIEYIEEFFKLDPTSVDTKIGILLYG